MMTKEEALYILALSDDKVPELVNDVFEIRKKYKGIMVSVQILTNAKSGACTENCAYCAQSCVSTGDIETYEMVPRERLIEDGITAKKNNMARHCIGLSGMHFTDEQIEVFAGNVESLKEKSPLPICCSIGFLTENQALRLKKAGVERINHNLNSSERFYPEICTTHKWKDRVENIRMLQRLGFEICSGGIIGMGESSDDIVDMFFALREIGPQAVPVNFLLPQEGTPLGNSAGSLTHLTPEYCLKVLCLARMLIPRADIRCAAGREAYLKGKERELFSIVDSIFAAGYLTADGETIEETLRSIKNAGFEYAIE